MKKKSSSKGLFFHGTTYSVVKSLGAVTATCTHTRVQSGRPQMEKGGPEKMTMEGERRPSSYINTNREIRRRNDNLLMSLVVKWPSGLALL